MDIYENLIHMIAAARITFTPLSWAIYKIHNFLDFYKNKKELQNLLVWVYRVITWQINCIWNYEHYKKDSIKNIPIHAAARITLIPL